MYIRLKIYEKRENYKFNNPLFSYEINGTHAVKLMILYLVETFYSKQLRDKIKDIIETSER